MPTQTFFNLEKEKQKKIITSAVNEFSKVSYVDASINQVIINAAIPRGSFYMYFKDKADLFEYIIKEHAKKVEEQTIKTIINNDGNLKESFIQLYDNVLDRVNKKQLKIFFKNIFIFVNINSDHFENPEHKIYDSIKDIIKTDNMRTTDIEFVFKVLMKNLFLAISQSIKHPNCDIKKENYLKNLDILCYGIYKEENK